MASLRERALSPPLGDIHHNPCVESLGDIISSLQARLGGSSISPNRLHEDWKIFAVICAGGFISRDLILLELMGTPVRVINSNSKGGPLEDSGGKGGVRCITARVIVRGEVVTGPVWQGDYPPGDVLYPLYSTRYKSMYTVHCDARSKDRGGLS